MVCLSLAETGINQQHGQVTALNSLKSFHMTSKARPIGNAEKIKKSDANLSLPESGVRCASQPGETQRIRNKL